jgi:cardiolipin synthase
VRVHVATLVVLLVVPVVLLFLLWSVINHRSFELETHHRGTLEEELPAVVAMSGGSLVPGNQVEIGHDGDFFVRLLRDLEDATETIHLETYVWWSGEICDRVANTLADKARQGVEVRLIGDWHGARTMDEKLQQTMRDAGVEVVFFHPPRLRSIGRFNSRTHRKIAVIDGKVAYIFGHGFAQEWAGEATDRSHYRDTFARVRGPIVNQIQAVFFENWLEETRKLPFGQHYFPEPERAGDVDAHIAYVSSTGDVSAVETLYYGVIASATREVLIQNPYFVIEDLGIALFRDAAARGVRVKVMLPAVHSTDSAVVQHASHRHFETLLEAGVEIWEYQRALLHQKVMIVDDLWASIGSANFDDRSFELNDELQLGLVDAGVARELEAAWDEDIRHARKLELAEWRERSLWHRFVDWASYTVNEQL